MNLHKLAKSVRALKGIMAIRNVLATLSEEDLVAVDQFFSEKPEGMSEAANRAGVDMQTFTRLLMFFRSEVTTRCMSLEEIKKTSEALQAERP